MGIPGTPLGMLVPPELEPDELPLGLDELGVDPLCPDGLDDGEEEGDDGDEDGLLGDGLLGEEGELLGDGMLGEGMPEDGLLGGGWLLLFDEHPATASTAAMISAGSPPAALLSVTEWFRCIVVTLSPPAIGVLPPGV